MVNLLLVLSNIDPTMLIVAIVLIFILQSPLLTFPGYLIMLFSGLHFGAFQGGLINFSGLLASAAIGYSIGRWTSVDFQQNDGNRFLRRFQDIISHHGMSSVVILRVFPILPYNVVSWGSGFSKLQFKKYMLSSVLPLIGWSFFWSYVGARHALRILTSVNLDLNIYHAVGLGLFLLMIVGLKIYQIKKK